MGIPVIHTFPVKRPGFIATAQWQGPDDDLALAISFPDIGGISRSLTFQTRSTPTGNPGEICLPTSNDLNDLGPRARDVLVAHTRMACMIAGLAVPGSKEFLDAFVQSDTNNLQSALGMVKVTAVTPTTDQLIDLTYKQGTGPGFVVTVDHGELNNYIFVPETQLLVVPGAIKKQFPTYVHDYPGTILTAAQRQAIVDYVLTLEPWV